MWKNLQKKLGSSESYISLALGLAVVLMLGSLVYNYLTRKPQTVSQENKAAQLAGESPKLPTKHVVQKGETLWSISEKYYQTGYNWTEIQKVNKLTDSDGIETGQTLEIPNVTPAATSPSVAAAASKPSAAPTASAPSTAPTGSLSGTTGSVSGTSTSETSPSKKTYKVVKGDSLWKIAVKEYNDGYKWTAIARANTIAHPDLIYPDTVLVLP